MSHDTERAGAAATRRLVHAARQGGLAHLVQAVHWALEAEAAVFDAKWQPLASSPARAIWDPDEVAAAVADGRLTTRHVELDGERVAVLATRAAGDPEGLLEVASDLVAMELQRHRDALVIRRRIAADLVDDVVRKRVSDDDAVLRLDALGVDARRPIRVLLGTADVEPERRQRLVWGGLQASLGGTPDPFLRLVYRDQAFMIVPDGPVVDRIAGTLLGHLRALGPDARVGVSLAHTGGEGIRAAYYEALSAMRQGDGVQHPADLDLTALLIASNSTLPLRALAERHLGPLIEHDREHGSDLVATLRGYLASRRNVVETTERLFIHRNTLRYRLRQITELTGDDLEDSRTVANLWLAFGALDDPGPTTEATT